MNLSTSYRADVNVSYERDENLYVSLRDRRLLEKMGNNLSCVGANDRHRSIKKSSNMQGRIRGNLEYHDRMRKFLSV